MNQYKEQSKDKIVYVAQQKHVKSQRRHSPVKAVALQGYFYFALLTQKSCSSIHFKRKKTTNQSGWMHTTSYWVETSLTFGSGWLWFWLFPITLLEHTELSTKKQTFVGFIWRACEVKVQRNRVLFPLDCFTCRIYHRITQSLFTWEASYEQVSKT